MDGEAALRQLASTGFAEIKGDDLEGIVCWCSVQCDSGDGRFCIVAGALEDLRTWWVEDNPTGVPTRLLKSIEDSILSLLPQVLSQPSGGASEAAARLRQEIVYHLLPTRAWEPWLRER